MRSDHEEEAQQVALVEEASAHRWVPMHHSEAFYASFAALLRVAAIRRRLLLRFRHLQHIMRTERRMSSSRHILRLQIRTCPPAETSQALVLRWSLKRGTPLP